MMMGGKPKKLSAKPRGRRRQRLKLDPTTPPHDDPAWEPTVIYVESIDDFYNNKPQQQPEQQTEDDDDDDVTNGFVETQYPPPPPPSFEEIDEVEVDIKPDMDSLGKEEQVQVRPVRKSSRLQSKPRKVWKNEPPPSSPEPTKKPKRKAKSKKKAGGQPNQSDSLPHPPQHPESILPLKQNDDDELIKLKKEERRLKSREMSALRRAFSKSPPRKYPRRALTAEEKEERNKRVNFQRFARLCAMSEEELREEKMARYMKRCAWLATLTPAELEEKKRKYYARRLAQKAQLSEEEKEEARRRKLELRRNLTEEEKLRRREMTRIYCRRYWEKMREERPLEYRARMHTLTERHRDKMLAYQRDKTQNESAEQREKRLLKYRVNQAKRKVRRQLEEAGELSPEEIERKVEEVAEQVRNAPRPLTTSQYRAREGARKPHAKRAPVVTPEEAGIVIRTGKMGRYPKYPELFEKIVKEGGGEGAEGGEKEDKGKKEKKSLPKYPTLIPRTWVVQQLDDEPKKKTRQEEEEVKPVLLNTFQIVFEPPLLPPSDPLSEDFTERGGGGHKVEVNFNSCPTTPPPPAYDDDGADDAGDDHFEYSVEYGGGDGDEVEGVDVGEPTLPSSTSPQFFGDQILVLSSVEPAVIPRVAVAAPPAPTPSPKILVASSSPPLGSTSIIIITPPTPSLASVPSQPQPDLDLKVKQEGDQVQVPRSSSEEQQTTSSSSSTAAVAAAAEMCDICGKVLKSATSMKLHKELVHNPSCSMTTCPQCGTECSSTRSLWSHYSSSHLEPISNMAADDLLPSYNPMIPPSRLGRPPAGIPSSILQKRSNGSASVCWHCGKSFKQKCTMDDHIRRVHEGRGHYCELCPGRGDLQSAAKLWKHKVDKHGIPPEELPPPEDRWGVIPSVSCIYCSELLLRGYEAHVKKHHPDKLDEWRKAHPPVKKIKPASLRTPKLDRVGSGSTPPPNPKCATAAVTMAECPHCSKSVLKSSLTRHLRNVHGIGRVEQFKCDECGQEFKERHRLREHVHYRHQYDDVDDRLEVKGLVRFDDGGRLVECLVCNQRMEIHLKYTLRAHFVSHHHQLFDEVQASSEPLFACDHCPEPTKFARKRQLLAHLESAHPDKTTKPSSDGGGGEGRRCGFRPGGGGRRKPNLGTKTRIKELAQRKTVCQHPNCSEVVSLRELSRHLRVDHGEEDPRFVCEYCLKTFKRRDYHILHLELRHQVPREQLIIEPPSQGEGEQGNRAFKRSYKRRSKTSKSQQSRKRKSGIGLIRMAEESEGEDADDAN